MKYNPVLKMFGAFLFNENVMYWGANKAHDKILLINKVIFTNNKKIIKKGLIITMYPYIICEPMSK